MNIKTHRVINLFCVIVFPKYVLIRLNTLKFRLLTAFRQALLSNTVPAETRDLKVLSFQG